MRWDIINKLIEEGGYRKYLEIGTQSGKCFNLVRCENKEGVDREEFRENGFRPTYLMESEVFWESLRGEEWDMVFVDADHGYRESRRDAENALEHLAEGGVLVMHDCYPKTKDMEGKERSGQVWKTIMYLRSRPDLDVVVIDEDFGVGIIRKKGRFNEKMEYGKMRSNPGRYLGVVDKY